MNGAIQFLVALIPVVAIFVLLVGLRWPAVKAMPLAFVATAFIAWWPWGMPGRFVFAAAVDGLFVALALLIIVYGALFLLYTLRRSGGMDAICLMGVTSGYLVDPKAASEVLRILCCILGIEVSLAALEERAKEMEKIIGKLQEMERAQAPYEAGGDEDLRYIG